MTQLSDSDLMRKLCAGSNDALTVLFERYSKLAYHTAWTVLHDEGEAEETVQQVFLDVFRAARKFDPQRGEFRTWLMQYVYHRSFDRRRHLISTCFYEWGEIEALADEWGGYGRQESQSELKCLVKDALSLLTAKQRQAVEMTYFEGLTAVEIAAITGGSAVAVRSNLYRGMKAIRNILAEPVSHGAGKLRYATD